MRKALLFSSSILVFGIIFVFSAACHQRDAVKQSENGGANVTSNANAAEPSPIIADNDAADKEFPFEIRKILDENFRGWKHKKLLPEIESFLHENRSPDTRGDFISGDFDGDGQKDYAVLIQHGEDILNDGTKLKRDLPVAFIRSGETYKHFVLSRGGDYIELDKKGTTAFDHDTNNDIRFKTDAITVIMWEKAARSYVWQRGKFVYYQTSD